MDGNSLSERSTGGALHHSVAHHISFYRFRRVNSVACFKVQDSSCRLLEQAHQVRPCLVNYTGAEAKSLRAMARLQDRKIREESLCLCRIAARLEAQGLFQPGLTNRLSRNPFHVRTRARGPALRFPTNLSSTGSSHS